MLINVGDSTAVMSDVHTDMLTSPTTEYEQTSKHKAENYIGSLETSQSMFTEEFNTSYAKSNGKKIFCSPHLLANLYQK